MRTTKRIVFAVFSTLLMAASAFGQEYRTYQAAPPGLEQYLRQNYRSDRAARTAAYTLMWRYATNGRMIAGAGYGISPQINKLFLANTDPYLIERIKETPSMQKNLITLMAVIRNFIITDARTPRAQIAALRTRAFGTPLLFVSTYFIAQAVGIDLSGVDTFWGYMAGFAIDSAIGTVGLISSFKAQTRPGETKLTTQQQAWLIRIDNVLENLCPRLLTNTKTKT